MSKNNGAWNLCIREKNSINFKKWLRTRYFSYWQWAIKINFNNPTIVWTRIAKEKRAYRVKRGIKKRRRSSGVFRPSVSLRSLPSGSTSQNFSPTTCLRFLIEKELRAWTFFHYFITQVPAACKADKLGPRKPLYDRLKKPWTAEDFV